MGQESSGANWKPFYLSGKVGGPFYGITANAFALQVGAANNGLTLVKEVLVKADGSLSTMAADSPYACSKEATVSFPLSLGTAHRSP